MGRSPSRPTTGGVSVVHRDQGRIRRVIGADFIHEVVADVRFRITGPAFFQVNTPGADQLVRLVGEALEPTLDDVLLDAYSGGGLFTATVGTTAGRVVAVETGEEAVADLQHNLRVNDCFNAELIDGRVEDVLADPVDDWSIAICDPPRTGLGRDGVMGIVQPRPRAHRLRVVRPGVLRQRRAVLRRRRVRPRAGDAGRPVSADVPRGDCRHAGGLGVLNGRQKSDVRGQRPDVGDGSPTH